MNILTPAPPTDSDNGHSRRRSPLYPGTSRAFGVAAFSVFTLLLFLSGTAFAYVRTTTCIPASQTSNDDPFACAADETPIPIAWPAECIEWRFAPTVDADGPFATALRAAFTTWNDVGCSYFVTRYAGTTDQDEVGYSRSFGANGNHNIVTIRDDWGGRSNQIVALTSVSYGVESGTIFDADIEFNEEHFNFAVLDGPSALDPRMDIQNVATHEVGHFIGLDHSTADQYVGSSSHRQATMFAQTFAGEVARRTLDDDDIQGACEIYPAESQSTPLCSSNPPDYVTSPSGFEPGDNDSDKKGCNRCSSTGTPPAPGGVALLLSMLLLVRRPLSRRRLK